GSPGARPRSSRMTSSVLTPSGSLKRPRAREIASSTFLRRMMRPPSSSTLSRVPLVSPRASRTALGSVIWPRSATVASMARSSALHSQCGMRTLYILSNTYWWPHTGLPRTHRLHHHPYTRWLPARHDIHTRSPAMADSFSTRDRLEVNGKSYTYASLAKLGTQFDLARLPYSMKILLENLLRHEDGGITVGKEHIEAVARWDATAEPDTEIAFMPARVVLQDFTGVPCVVDLAAMRDAVARLGGSPEQINPLIPSELVIDHSVQVDVFGRPDALDLNGKIEFERNKERYGFLRWGQNAFGNFKVVPPNTGIVHQVNLENLARVVMERELEGETWAFPDTVFGTDSHTTM